MEKNVVCGSYIPAENLAAESAAAIDFTRITHAFLAFSLLHERDGRYVPFFSEGLANGIRTVQNEIRRQNAGTKVLVSIGGWGAGLFCEASSNEENREAFAAECADLIRQFNLDGLDIDWEFPGMASEGVNACEHCQADYVLLCEEIRRHVGDKLLTAAMGSDHWNRLDNVRLNKVFDLVNVMTYDMNTSAHSSMTYTHNAMSGWETHGIDREKLVLGVPFYARCENPAYEWKGYSELMGMVERGEAELLRTPEQDYVVIDGNRLSIDTPESIQKKVAYIKEHHYAGIFNWQELTDRNGELRRAMADSFGGADAPQ